MIPILLAGPRGEPVSLAEAKAWLKIDTTDEDDLIGALVTSARLIVESMTRRLLMTQSWRLSLDAWPKGNVFVIPLAPFRAVDAVRIFDAGGEPQILSTTLYSVDAAPDRARLAFASAPPAPGRAAAGIEIDVSVGYGDAAEAIPQPLRQAILLLAARWFEDRGDALGDRDDIPAPVNALVRPWRRARLA